MNEEFEAEENALVNQITLDCLLNREQYEKYLQRSVHKKVKERDRKFYRKRLIHLTKELLSSTDDNNVEFIPRDIVYVFDNYAKMCIEYFKMSDKSDLLQEDYQHLGKKKTKETEELGEEGELGEQEEQGEHGEQEEQEEQGEEGEQGEGEHDFLQEEPQKKEMSFADKSFMTRSVTFQGAGLDSFLSRKVIKKKASNIILPQQKNVNLRDPSLKNKGIRQKKNININYEEDTKESKVFITNDEEHHDEFDSKLPLEDPHQEQEQEQQQEQEPQQTNKKKKKKAKNSKSFIDSSIQREPEGQELQVQDE